MIAPSSIPTFDFAKSERYESGARPPGIENLGFSVSRRHSLHSASSRIALTHKIMGNCVSLIGSLYRVLAAYHKVLVGDQPPSTNLEIISKQHQNTLTKNQQHTESRPCFQMHQELFGEI